MKILKKILMISLVAIFSIQTWQMYARADTVSRQVIADNVIEEDEDVVDCIFESLNEEYVESGETYQKWIGGELFQDSNSYGNIAVFYAPKDTDLTKIILKFTLDDGADLYLKDSRTPIISEETVLDFSRGILQFNAVSKDGKFVKNYIVSVIKSKAGDNKLYINSFANQSNTLEKDGVIYTTRKISLDKSDAYEHSIEVANYGSKDINDVSVELVSDTLDLVTDTGLVDAKKLSPLNDDGEGTSEIILARKDGVKDDAMISGMLTIKSKGKRLAVLALNGIMGAPIISTNSLPDAVRLVPYGAKIESSLTNKNNKVRYSLSKGSLPKGLEVKSNGEVYGIPEETGSFTFTVKISNSLEGLNSNEKEFILTVNKDTEKRVDNYTSEGYEITTELKDVNILTDKAKYYRTVSQGDFHNFKNVYIDGKALIRDEEYTAVEGSTIITIIAETLKRKTSGSHNITLEFRDKDTGGLRVAAQKFKIIKSKNVAKSHKAAVKKAKKVKKAKNNGVVSLIKKKKKNTVKPGKIVKNKQPKRPKKPVKPGITPNTTEYVIKAGDTLWDIAEAKYGSGTEWIRIIAVNEGIIPEKLKVGQKIKIP